MSTATLTTRTPEPAGAPIPMGEAPAPRRFRLLRHSLVLAGRAVVERAASPPSSGSTC